MEQENNYLAGTLMAFLGALIGVIPWLVLEWLVSFYTALLAVLIGYAAFAGYKLVARVTEKTKFIIIGVTVVTIILTVVINLGISLYINFGEVLIEDIIYNLFDNPDYMQIAYTNLGIALLITVFSFRSLNTMIERDRLKAQ